MEPLTRVDLLIILGVVQLPGHSWTVIRRAINLDARLAMRTRDRLVAEGVLLTDREFTRDKFNRRRPLTVYRANPDLREVQELAEWVAGGQQFPLTLLALHMPNRPPARRPPGIHASDTERVLDAILRNPEHAWHVVKDASGLNSLRARIARDELYDGKHLCAGFREIRSKHGKVRCVPKWEPNEASPLVQELRKRYAIKLGDPPIINNPVPPMPERETGLREEVPMKPWHLMTPEERAALLAECDASR